MHQQRAGVMAASGLLLLAGFLPWIEIDGASSYTAASGIGWALIALALVSLALATTGDRSEPLARWRAIGASVPALIGAAAAARAITHYETFIAGSGLPAGRISLGPGPYVFALAGLAVPVLAFVLRDRDG